MRTRSFGVCFVLIGTALALCGIARGEDVTYAFTGTGDHGTQAWGQFTTSLMLYPGAYEPGGIYSGFSLTVSNIPGPGPGIGVLVFHKADLEQFSAFSMSTNGVLTIVPLGDYDLGPPDHNFYRLSGGIEGNQSVLTYNNTYRDDITWSVPTPVSPPPPVLSVEPGANSIVALSWTTNATGFTLEETISLAPSNWSVVTNVPVSTNENFLVMLPRTNDMHFFRLKWPGQ